MSDESGDEYYCAGLDAAREEAAEKIAALRVAIRECRDELEVWRRESHDPVNCGPPSVCGCPTCVAITTANKLLKENNE